MSSTPTLEKVLNLAIESRIAQLHTCFPGIVERYDSAKQQADIQPAIKKKYSDGAVVKMPLLTNVPVLQPRAGKAMVHMPIKTGDIVFVMVAERSVDKWLNQGGVVDPEDARKFDLSDAFAYPGGYPFSDAGEVSDADALILRNDKFELKALASGKVSLKNLDTGEEIVSMFDEYQQAVLDARTATLFGPMPLVNPQFALIKARFLASFKES